MKKVDTGRMQSTKMRMMCGKTLRDGIPNRLLRDRTGREDLRESSGRDQIEMAWAP